MSRPLSILSTRRARSARSALLLDTSVPALVLRLHPLHHGGLGIVRTLGRAGVPVYAVRDACFTAATTSRYLRGSFVVDAAAGSGLASVSGPVSDRTPGSAPDPDASRGATPGFAFRVAPISASSVAVGPVSVLRDQAPALASSSAMVDRLLAIGRELGGRVVLVPTDDASAVLIAENAGVLAETFLFPVQSPSLPRLVSDKAALYRWCERRGIACPQSVCPETDEAATAFLAQATFPLVAKVAESWTVGRQASVKSTTIVATAGEAMALRSALVADGGGARLLFQEYIPPECGEDWFFHGYCDERSECVLSFTGTKARSFPPYAGMTTLGRAVDNDALRSSAERLLSTLGYRGAVDLCYRFDGRDGRFKLLDFNPRVGAQFRLFENTAGVDVVTALHLDMTGRPVPRGPQAPDRVLLVESYDTLAAMRYLRDGALRYRDWRSSRREATERGWFATDDPVPYAAMCLRMSGRLSSKAFEHLSTIRARRTEARLVSNDEPGTEAERLVRSSSEHSAEGGMRIRSPRGGTSDSGGEDAVASCPGSGEPGSGDDDAVSSLTSDRGSASDSVSEAMGR